MMLYRELGQSTCRRHFDIRTGLLLFLPFSYVVCKPYTSKCSGNNPARIPQEWYQPADLIIGGVVSHIHYVISNILFNKHPSQEKIHFPFIVTKFYQHVLALVFSVDEINKNPKILPNFTLGFHICDSYSNSRMTYRTILDVLFKSHQFTPNYKCGVQKNVIGIIGGLNSDTSSYMADILSLYKIPQFAYVPFQPEVSDEFRFPAFYNMVPNEALQYQGIIQLLLHFMWKWVGLIVVNDDRGDHFLQTLEPMLSQNGICSEFTERIDKNVYFLELPAIINVTLNHLSIFMERKANVFVIYGESLTIMWLASVILVATVFPVSDGQYIGKVSTGKVWITTAQTDFTLLTFHKAFDMQMFHGSLSFTIHSKPLPAFKTFLQRTNPSGVKENGFIADFWEQAFECFMPNSDLAKDTDICTGQEMLESLPAPIFEMSMTGHSYSIYNAVHALARVLHNHFTPRSNHRAMRDEDRLALPNVEPWQLHSLIQRTLFNNSVGDEIKFSEHGDLEAAFDITNLVTFPNNSYIRVKVGKLDPQSPPSKMFIINEDKIQWHRDFTQVPPLSICNNHCQPGYRKKKIEWKKFCCYDCVPCPDGMFTDQTDKDTCARCPEGHYANKFQNLCIPKSPNFLAFGDTLALVSTFFAFVLSLITAIVLGIFVAHRNTAVVKANNIVLTYILLISLLLCFLCSLLFIGMPSKICCLFRQTSFGIIFSIALSSILAKTISVVLAFMATKPGSQMRKWVGKRLAYSVLLSCSGFQAGICLLWLITSPPFPDLDTHSLTEEIILLCNEGSITMFYCVLGYMGLLSLISFTVAFLARKLPDSFNEAKFITFSTFVFCSVWLSFVPAYLSTRGKSMVAVEIFSILASGAALLSCIFFPKCYIIVLRPDLNKREHLIQHAPGLK